MRWLLALMLLPVLAWGQCVDNVPSACGNGPSGAARYGYACPDMMMLTDAMIDAAKKDGLHASFAYAVAGSANDSECGKCYQVMLLDAEREWRSDFKQIIIQVVNSGFDVMSYQFDIFMGGGGFGYFTSCNSDCTTNYCQGGACRQSMFSGRFKDWVNAQYNDPNLCYSGGIKWLDQKNNTELVRLCRRMSPGNSTKSRALLDSCYRTNVGLYHQNFVGTRSTRVQCPKSLIDITGLKRTDDVKHPRPSKTLSLPNACTGSRKDGRYCITTMQDCCKMSCSWSGKIPSYALDDTHKCVRTCDRDGRVIPA